MFTTIVLYFLLYLLIGFVLMSAVEYFNPEVADPEDGSSFVWCVILWPLTSVILFFVSIGTIAAKWLNFIGKISRARRD